MSLDLFEFATRMGCKEVHILTDNKLNLNGVIAIYSSKRGPALGGCRFLPYETGTMAIVDAMKLAKSMALKAAIANLPLGGGKAVLITPKGKFNREEMLRAFGKFINNLNGRYITAVDTGTSVADMDYIAKETPFVTSTSKFSYSNCDPSIATARGVFQGILAAVKFKFLQDDLQGIHVAIQGAGNVGYNLIKLLYVNGAKISVCDINKARLERCKAEFSNINIINNPENIYQVNAEVFSPCALGEVLNNNNIEKIKAKIIAGGANNQLSTDEDAEFLQQLGVLYAPDFVINAGGVIYVAGPVLKQTEAETLKNVDYIYNRLLNVFKVHVEQQINTHKVAYQMALKNL